MLTEKRYEMITYWERLPFMKQDFTPVKTIVIDQDRRIRDQICAMITHHSAYDLVACVSTGEEGIARIHSEHPDLIILDIELPDMSGFDLLHRISPFMRPQYVFLSTTEHHAIRAFEYFAFDYLLKPFTDERLQLTLIKVKEQMYQKQSGQIHEKLNALFRYLNPVRTEAPVLPGNGTPKLLPVKMSGRIYFLHPDDIMYVEAAGYYIEVFANAKKHLIRQSLNQLGELLDNRRFMRIHRSVIINLSYLKEIIRDGVNDFSVRMADDKVFKISRSYKTDVFNRIGL